MLKRSGNNQLQFTDHARQRMAQRKINIAQVEAILRHGTASPGKDGKIHYAVDPSAIIWSPDASSTAHRLYGTEVVMSLDGWCITVYRKDDTHAS